MQMEFRWIREFWVQIVQIHSMHLMVEMEEGLMDHLSYYNSQEMAEVTIQTIKLNNSPCNKEEGNKMHFQTWLFTTITSLGIKTRTQWITPRMETIEWVVQHSNLMSINCLSQFNLRVQQISWILVMDKIRDKRRVRLELKHSKGK